MTTVIEAIGAKTIDTSHAFLDFFKLIADTFRAIYNQIVNLRPRYRETLDQLYLIGVQSLPMILFSLAFVSLSSCMYWLGVILVSDLTFS